MHPSSCLRRSGSVAQSDKRQRSPTEALSAGESLSVPCLLALLPWSLSQPVSQGRPGPCLPFTDMAFAPLRRM
ncbi:unnamed protein product [Lota lota]